MKLQKTLVYFDTSIRGNEVLIGRLKNIFQNTGMLDMELLDDAVIELRQAYCWTTPSSSCAKPTTR